MFLEARAISQEQWEGRWGVECVGGTAAEGGGGGWGREMGG